MMLRRRLLLALRSVALLGAVAGLLLLDGLAGAQDGRERQRERAPYDVASVAQLQTSLLERALANLQGSRLFEPPKLYFLGFAGYGPQAVFKREALAVRALFDARFGTRSRSLILVNHWSTANDTALASPENLDRALQHIGRLMHPETD